MRNQSRARATSNFIISRNCGVARRSAMSLSVTPNFARLFQRQIDSSLCVIHRDVLPEVRQLQRGAGVVGKLLPLGIAIAAQVQHQMSHGIRGVLAVAQHVLECGIARDGLVLAKCREQLGKRRARNIELADRLAQRDEYRMRGLTDFAPQLEPQASGMLRTSGERSTSSDR